jgi:hypothetical protein
MKAMKIRKIENENKNKNLTDNRQLLVGFKGENNVFARDVGESFDGLSLSLSIFIYIYIFWFLNFFKRHGLHKYTSKCRTKNHCNYG